MIVENRDFNHISRQSENLWMGPLTLEQFEGNMYFLSTEDGRNFKILVNQVYLRDYVPGMTYIIYSPSVTVGRIK